MFLEQAHVATSHFTEASAPHACSGMRGIDARVDAFGGESGGAPMAPRAGRLALSFGTRETETDERVERTRLRHRAVRSRHRQSDRTDHGSAATAFVRECVNGSDSRILFGVASISPPAGARSASESDGLSCGRRPRPRLLSFCASSATAENARHPFAQCCSYYDFFASFHFHSFLREPVSRPNSGRASHRGWPYS